MNAAKRAGAGSLDLLASVFKYASVIWPEIVALTTTDHYQSLSISNSQ